MEIKFEHVKFIIDKNTPLEKTILNDISFEINKNGVYSFIGASNSGKTAIGDLINALVKPNYGKVIVGSFINDGRRIKNINKLRVETGYVFKNPYDMFFNSTVKKEIEFGMIYFKYKLDKIDLRAVDALKLVGLDESYLNLNPLRLTLVDAKKVALACALIYNPKILILDEYTNGLNNKDKNELVLLLRLLKNKYKKTIILLTKDTDISYQISDEIFLLHKTKLVAKGDKNILRDTQLLKKINLEVPPIVSFIEQCNKKGHEISDHTNILDLIKEVYRNVF
ncbi:MAG: ATP-binding cassette domain-containing protein [Tenericutes bacterium]|nr:ATP-binding cassette domain-containing protein [Mycoplasmatota bacterium]